MTAPGRWAGRQRTSRPKSGTEGPAGPTAYLSIQNNSTSGKIIWFSPLPGVAATAAPPSWQLVPTAGFDYTSTDPMPPAVSVIASASGGTLLFALLGPIPVPPPQATI